MIPAGTGDTRLASSAGPVELAEALQRRAQEAIAAALPVTVTATVDADGHRTVSIGGLHAASCGGTHVASLADLAGMEITGIKVKGGRVRIAYTAEHRPHQRS